MDQYLSTVIIAVITGVFSIITLLLNKKTNAINDKIEEKNVFNEKEKALKRELNKKEQELEKVVHDIMIMTLDTNMLILSQISKIDETGIVVDMDKLQKLTNELKNNYKTICTDIEDIRQEYEIMLDVANKFQEEIEKLNAKS